MSHLLHFADLQVASHRIRAHQPGILIILDSVLADARTLAHRIINHGNQGGIVAGATKLHQQPGTAMLFIEGGSRLMGSCPPAEGSTRAIADQTAAQQVYRDVPHGRRKNKMSGQVTGPARAHKARPPEPFFTNPKLEPRQLPTRTVWTNKEKWKRHCNTSPRHPGSSKSPRRRHQL